MKLFELFTLVALVLISTLSPRSFAERPTLVVFTASWSASCREVVPVVQEVGAANGLLVKTVDVDDANAPKLARSLGLSIPASDPPQVFLLGQGAPKLLLDGKSYVIGRRDALRGQLLQRISP
jgi:thiol-disulfide isomerase/thioredoxin